MTPPRIQSFSCGPLTFDLEDGGLRYIRLGDREILRRVYVAVRDRAWNTIPIAITGQTIDSNGENFSCRFVADHAQGPIHFRWHGQITGTADGTITYRMDGEAVTSFTKNRIGICVLHPIDECSGRPCRVGHSDGTVALSRFPELISGHQPFFDIQSISHEVLPGLSAEVRFAGEVFEMEDQRNWCDASYKTYSTPLALPRPVVIEAGTRVTHEVTLRLIETARASVQAPLAVRPGSAEARAVTLAVDVSTARPLPGIGVTLTPGDAPVSALEIARLGSLHLAHLRVDLAEGRADAPALLERAARAARALDLPLELALVAAAPGAPDGLAPLAAKLRELTPPVTSILVLSAQGDVTARADLERVRAAIAPIVPGTPLAAGSSVYFTEVNRNRTVVEGADAVVFTNSPQIHMDDDGTLIENLAPLRWIADTARSFSGARPLILSPVTLRVPPRGPRMTAASHVVPDHADPRQASLFAAGWTAAHVGVVAQSGFARATYFESRGALGLVRGEEGPALPAPYGGPAGSVLPPFLPLADVGDFAGGEVLATRSSQPLAVQATLLRRGGRMRLLLANLTGIARAVTLPAVLPLVHPASRTRRLNASTLSEACARPESFWAAVRPLAASSNMETTLDLAPHELVTIDLER